MGDDYSVLHIYSTVQTEALDTVMYIQGHIAISGIMKDESTVLKSAMMPIKLVCRSADPSVIRGGSRGGMDVRGITLKEGEDIVGRTDRGGDLKESDSLEDDSSVDGSARSRSGGGGRRGRSPSLEAAGKPLASGDSIGRGTHGNSQKGSPEPSARSSGIGQEGRKDGKTREMGSRGQDGDGEGMQTVLLKTCNDLRRDQLILGCIDLMDMLLQEEGIDLRIVTYRVTATSVDTGFVQWVKDSYDLQYILDHYGDIRHFFRAHSKHANIGALFHVFESAEDAYIGTLCHIS